MQTNIQDIMLRAYKAEEDAERQERQAIMRRMGAGEDCAAPWAAVVVVFALIGLALAGAFAAGMYYQSRRAAARERDEAVEHATRHAEGVARDNCRDCVHNPED